MTLTEFAERIKTASQSAHTEAALQIQLEPLLAALLSEYGIGYTPAVNESLRSLGLSRVDSTRPDSVFGHVVLDYKAPALLASPADLTIAKEQVTEYLKAVAAGERQEPSRWAGVLWDGLHVCFCHFDGVQWRWSMVHDISAASLLTLATLYRSLTRKPLSAAMLARTFGKESAIAEQVLFTMCTHLGKPRHRTKMLFREWRRLFEQVSTYELDQLPALKEWARVLGVPSRNASRMLFAIHSYYALVVKLLTSELLNAVTPIHPASTCERIANAADPTTLYGYLSDLEDGEYWRRYRISNFLEGDFFSWYTSEHSAELADAIRELARGFLQFEPATAVLRPETIRDLLKEFYTTLVDEQIRHDLGEYYTPDWLAQMVLDEVGYTGDLEATVLDPACGSGTFLVECVARIRRTADTQGVLGRDLLRVILSRIKGIDLNPLAVISARANFVLATADLIFDIGEDVEIPVYLADCVNVPMDQIGQDGLQVFRFTLDTEIAQYEFEVPECLLRLGILGQVLLACEDALKEKRSLGSFLSVVEGLIDEPGVFDDRVQKRIEAVYGMMATLEERDWNKIWCRVLKNNFSPRGFAQIDYLVGNPPWVRWSRLPASYRERVKHVCQYYGLVSGRGYSGGIESDISTVVLFSSADHWLKLNGRVGMLITWTVFKSASARGFRIGALPGGQGIRLDHIADLTRVQPFPDATNETAICIGTKVARTTLASFEEIPCDVWLPKKSARIPPDARLSEVFEAVEINRDVACPTLGWGSPLWTGAKAAFAEAAVIKGRSNYLASAHRGTISDLARVYWVKVERFSPEANRALIRTLREDELTLAQRVDPVEAAWIEADLLYPLCRGRDLGRYCVATEGWYQIIPNRHYANVESEEDFAERYPCAYSYFFGYRDTLLKRATFRRYQVGLPFYVIYCVGEYTFAPWKVIWMEQQSPARFRCAVVSEEAGSIVPNRVLAPDHKLYFVECGREDEAHYVCAYLNSHPVRAWLGGFLHGKQIGTSVLEFTKLPKFDPTNRMHVRLARISKEAHRDRAGSRTSGPLRDEIEQELTDLVLSVSSFTRV